MRCPTPFLASPPTKSGERLGSIVHAHLLVSLADQVVGQALDGRGGVASDLRLSMVADDNGLLGLGDGDAGPALVVVKEHVSMLTVVLHRQAR